MDWNGLVCVPPPPPPPTVHIHTHHQDYIKKKNSIFVVKYIFPKYLPEFINNRLSSRSSECTAARFKYPDNRPGGGGRYSLPLRAVSSPRHSPLHTAHRLRGGR